MKLSVIIPVYNVQAYLPECLRSLSNQTYSDFELIFVNDGSTDASVDILNEYCKTHSNSVVYTKENGGLSDARNFGIRKAQGEYLAFIDSDDYIEQTMFEDMMEHMEKNSCDLVICDMTYIYDDQTRKFSSGAHFDLIHPKNNLDVITINNSACNKIFKRELFKEIEFPNGKWYEDLATIPIVLYRANKIGHVHKALYNYYQRTGSIAHRKHQKMFDIYEAIFHVNSVLIQEHGDPIQLKRAIGKLYINHGLFLTTLRIKEIENLQERAQYLKLNMGFLNQHYPEWRLDSYIKTYGIKQRIIFKLLEWQRFNLVARIYG